jgi:hypothetical protein
MTLTLGHLLMLGAAIAIVAAIASILTAMRHRGHGRGTPQYARARMARRSAIYAVAVAIFLAALCFTPLCHVELVGARA